MKYLIVIMLFSLLLVVGCGAPDYSSESTVNYQNTGSSSSGLTLQDCQEMDQQSLDAATCYSTIAREKSDYTICQNIVGQSNMALRSACYQEIAGKLQDASVCDKMTLPEEESYQLSVSIGNCKYYVDTIKQKEPSTSGSSGTSTTTSSTGNSNGLAECQNYANQEMMAAAQCYFKLAIAEKDYTICENIVGEVYQPLRIQCFDGVAVQLKDKSVCDKMTVPNYQYTDLAKQQCDLLVEKAMS